MIKFITSANSIIHDEFHSYTKESGILTRLVNFQEPIDVQDDFLAFYPKWIKSSELNSFRGFDSLPYSYMSIGVTQAIDDFICYTNKKDKRLRVFRGEYPYVRDTARPNIEYIEDAPLDKNDTVIISLPFSGTGNIHYEWTSLINQCNQLDIPVFVDCAFFGTCYNVSVDFNEPCIDTVSFSPSKGLNCGFHRSGIAFTRRSGEECSLDIQTEWHHGVQLNTNLCLNLMKNFSPDTVPLIYKSYQEKVCKEWGLKPTNTVHLALGDDSWSQFTRDDIANRVNLKYYLMDEYQHSRRK